MRRAFLAALLAVSCALALPLALKAAANDPLFINLTSDDAHRSEMAIGFGASQLQRGHGLTLFLNDRAVVLASVSKGAAYAGQQKMLRDLAQAGAAIYVCPTCMAHYGVLEADLLPGLRKSNPDLTGTKLFQDGAKTMSW